MRWCFALVLAAVFPVLTSFKADPAASFPVPNNKSKMLFYVQRSINKNTLIYELNEKNGQELDAADPIRVYWVNYAGKGDEEELSYVQRHYAYGLKARIADQEKKNFSFSFVSYDKQTLYLIRNEYTRKYSVYTSINGKMIRVKRIYIQIDGGSFWFPKVTYIEVSGVHTNTGEDITEKIVP